MSRESSIRVRNKDRELIRKLNARVYSKKSRLKKKELFPEIETKGITEFKTRKEFNAYIKEMERFTSREMQFMKTEKGVTLPLQTIENIEKRIERINKQKAKRKAEIENMEMTFKGKETGIKTGEKLQFFGGKTFESLIPLQFDPNRFKNVKEAEEFLEGIEERYKKDFFKKRDTLYKDNYLKAIENVFGNETGLYKIVKRMPLKKFMQFYYTENLAEIKHIYDKALRYQIHDILMELYA